MQASLEQADLTIVVPVLNEKDAVEKCHEELCRAMAALPCPCTVLFVDDGSRDGTAEALARTGCRFVRHPENRGYGAAIKTGARASRGAWIAIIDCDLTYPAAEIARLWPFTARGEMVVGARDPVLNPYVNRFAKKLSCGVFEAVFGRPVLDINSGLRIISREAFLYYAPAVCDRFSLTSSITLGFLMHHRPIAYVPIEYRPRVGHTKVRPWSYTRDFVRALAVMFRFCRRTSALDLRSA